MAGTRTRANAPLPPTLPASVLPAGNWTSLGPQPIADEKNFGGSTGSDYGPTSGRVTALVTDPADGSIVYAGTAGGGVWKSTDGGAHWATTMDNAANLAIGALAIDDAGTTSTRTIYAATGEDNGNADALWGAGILKSTDSGATWNLIGQGLPFSSQTHIGGIAVDRSTSGSNETVIIATDTPGAGGASGLWRSPDSGATWGSISLSAAQAPSSLPGKTASGDFIQVVQDPTSPNVFLAIASDFCQTEAGDVYESTDHGATWTASLRTPLSNGVARIGLGVGPLDTAYIALAGDCSTSNVGNLTGIQKGTKAMNDIWTWQPVSNPSPPDYMTFPGTGPAESQGWYDNVVAVDPTNPNNAVFGGIDIVSTTDGGQSFNVIGNPYNGGIIHPDFHALAFLPSSSAFYAGNDGGVWETASLTNANAWSNRNGNLNTLQFYTGTSPDPNHIVGGAQDNGTPGILPGSPAAAPSWQEYLDGDGGATVLDPTSGSTTMYATTAGGGVWKGSYQPPASADPSWPYNTFTDVSPCPTPIPNPTPPACSEATSFVTPLAMDQTNPSRLFTATTRVYQTTDAGASWNPLSAGSIANGPAPAGRSDFVATLVEGTTSTTNNDLFAGSYYGAMWETANANAASPTWTQINNRSSNALPTFSTSNHVPGHPWISGIAFNESNPAEIWATIGGINVGHVWHTTDGGLNWFQIDGTGATGISSTLPVNGIIYDPTVTSTVFIATDLGVLACQTCSGTSPVPAWETLGSGLPHVAVDGISENHNRDQIVAWTHGRGAWIVPLGPVLDVSPSQLTFTIGEGGAQPGSQTLTVTNDGVGTLHWNAAPNPPGSWLNVPSPATNLPAGQAPRQSMQVTISVNARGQPSGTQQASMVFTNVDTGSTTSVTITLVVPPFPGHYQPMPPCRVLDTRFGPGLQQKLQQGETRPIAIAGNCNVPPMNAARPPTAVVMNVTVTNPTQTSYLTVFPTGVSQPTASNLNFSAGQTVPNLVEVALGADGNVDVFNHTGSTDVIFDVEGWVAAQNTVTGTAGLFRPVVPYRILDTRNGSKLFQGDSSAITLQVANTGGAAGVPSTAAGVILNVTITNPTAASYLTVYPSDATRPTASNLNFVPGQTVPNRVQVKLGATGAVKIYNNFGYVDVVVDVNGWFTNGSNPNDALGQFTGVTPFRVLDTRFGPGQRPPLGPGQTMQLAVAGQGGVANMTDVVPPTAVVLNVTVTDTTAPSYLTLYPGDVPTANRPLASDLNWVPGLTVPNLVVVKLGTGGNVNIFNHVGSTNVVVDVVGWYS